jgi:outer membrane protein assembly factor BamB
VASSDGLVRVFDPANGALIGSLPLPAGAAAEPLVAGGTLYVLASDGTLNAFR